MEQALALNLDAGLGWVDWLLLIVLGVSVLFGLWRGLIAQVLSLVGWVIAFMGSQWWGPTLAPWVPVGSPGTRLNAAAGFVVAFVGLLIACSLVAWLIQKFIRASPLSAADRLLGGLFGMARAVMIGLAAVIVVGATPAADAASWRQSVGATWLTGLLSALRPVLPPEYLQLLPAAGVSR